MVVPASFGLPAIGYSGCRASARGTDLCSQRALSLSVVDQPDRLGAFPESRTATLRESARRFRAGAGPFPDSEFQYGLLFPRSMRVMLAAAGSDWGIGHE